MKANELMIGDLVRTIGCNPFRIGCVLGEAVCNDSDTQMWCDDEIEPIPLTPEILEKNGFEKIGTSYQYIARPGLYIRLIGISNKHLSLQIASRYIGLDYVHELQHALRLCKIEKEIVL